MPQERTSRRMARKRGREGHAKESARGKRCVKVHLKALWLHCMAVFACALQDDTKFPKMRLVDTANHSASQRRADFAPCVSFHQWQLKTQSQTHFPSWPLKTAWRSDSTDGIWSHSVHQHCARRQSSRFWVAAQKTAWHSNITNGI